MIINASIEIIVSSMLHQLVEAACRFWKIFDVAYTFYKILEIASKFSHALQHDCSMEVSRNIFDSLCKKSIQFLCNIHTYIQRGRGTVQVEPKFGMNHR